MSSTTSWTSTTGRWALPVAGTALAAGAAFAPGGAPASARAGDAEGASGAGFAAGLLGLALLAAGLLAAVRVGRRSARGPEDQEGRRMPPALGRRGAERVSRG